MAMHDTPAGRLKAARIAAGYRTAKEFAEKNGIPQPTYAMHEKGKRGISVDVAERYGAILGITAQELLFGTPRAEHLDDRETALLRNFQSMPPTDQEAFLRLASIAAGQNSPASGSPSQDPANTDSKPDKAAS